MKFIYAKGTVENGKKTVTFHEEEKEGTTLLSQYEVLIDVKACALSKINLSLLTGVLERPENLLSPAAFDVSGNILQVGKEIHRLSVGDRVAGIVPLDSKWTACAEQCVLNEYELVRIPDDVSYEVAAACLSDGVRAYIALQYQARLCAGDTVLVFDGASSDGSITCQLAHSWGAKVIATSSSTDNKMYLDKCDHRPDYILEMGSKTNILLSSVMEETGGVGVDIIIDSGVKLFTNEEDSSLPEDTYRKPVPSKHEIISCLAVNGKWITSHPSMQLDPPNCHHLFQKSASVGFLFEQSWLMSASQQGRYLHILADLLQKVSSGTIKPHISRILSYNGALQALREEMDVIDQGKTVIRIS